MTKMFGERINEFVLSVDIMDGETFKGLLNLIQSYVSNHLKVAYFSVLDETTIDDQPGLQTLWSTWEAPLSFTVGNDKDSYTSHTAYAFGENKPIWVVSESKIPLKKEDKSNLIDLWSKSEDLPAYSISKHDEVRTSVLHPLKRAGRPFGVVEFAAEKYVEPTPASLEEVRMLATIISRAHHMYDVRRAQRENTKHALKMLESALNTEDWKRLAQPQLFVAYPGAEELEMAAQDEHRAVISTIREEVDKFSNILEIIYWEDITEAGNINSQVIRDIGNSDFGLCYFSEPTKEGQYKDNENVLFEAGMMQALANSRSALLRSWIPVREKNPKTIPFDIAAERILFVDRIDDGKLDTKSFAKALKERVQSLLETPKDTE